MAETVQIPRNLIEELIRRSEALEHCIAPSDENFRTFRSFIVKIDEVRTCLPASLPGPVLHVQAAPAEVSTPAPEEEQGNDGGDGATEEETGPRRKVARRTRRVAKKLRTDGRRQVRPQVATPVGVPAETPAADILTPGHLQDNENLLYLEDALKQASDSFNQANVYLQYLGNCQFNSSYYPTSIIPFTLTDADQLANVARHINQNVPLDHENNAVVTKLKLALQHRQRLAIQQQQEIGQLLTRTSKMLGEANPPATARGRPRGDALLEMLDLQLRIGSSSSSLQEAIFVHRAVLSFPPIKFVNEPLRHLCCGDTRNALATIPDVICQTATINQQLHSSFVASSPFCLGADQHPQLSRSLPVDQLLINDGDGIVVGVNVTAANPMQSAVFTRLAQIDAPELCSVQYMRDNQGHLLYKFVGHHSMAVLTFLCHSFVSTGNGLLFHEVPKDGTPEPKDPYGRPIREFWVSWNCSPSAKALNIIHNYGQMLHTDTLRGRVMSLSDPVNASVEHPFLLNLNAFLVVAGAAFVFTKYCQDQRLLALQQIAKVNKVGPIWSGPTRNLVAHHNPNPNDALFANFNAVDMDSFYPAGFPTMFVHGNTRVFNFPWYERQSQKDLRQMGRGRANNEGKPTSSLAPYGYKILLETTAESALKIMKSKVVGVGGVDTGYGLFTMQPIPPNTWICAYAPSAAFEPEDKEGDYTLEIQYHGEKVCIDGEHCEIGLGKLLNDGSWPFTLLAKYSKIVKQRVNCQFKMRNSDEAWVKSLRPIAAGEELLLQYRSNNHYWTTLYPHQVINRIKEVLARGSPSNLPEVEQSLANINVT